jgi:hypothetical protein
LSTKWDTTYSQKDREPGYPLMNALGQIVGEEVVRAAGQIDRMTPTFEASGTSLKPGAEKAIVHNLVDMTSQY